MIMKRQANKDEKRVQKYLQTLNPNTLEYEPLGNVTPDFLIDEKTAVEVRRLNRNHIDGENLPNIENFEIPLIKNIKKIINSFESKPYKNSAYVSITLNKPVELNNKKNITKRVKKVLKKHAKSIAKTKSYKISGYLEITFTPTDKKSHIYFFSGCNNDFFWIVHELRKNIQTVIDEKNRKIKKNYHLYEEWWLILVDSIIYGLDEEDFEELKNIKLKKKKFSKVMILSPKGEFKTFEF